MTKQCMRTAVVIFLAVLMKSMYGQGLPDARWWNKITIQASAMINPLNADNPFEFTHRNVALGYQFSDKLGLGVTGSLFYRTAGSRYPAISFSAPFVGIYYRRTWGRFYGRVSLGHVDQVDAYEEGPISMRYYARGFSPALQVKAGMHFLRFLSVGLIGFNSGPVHMIFRDVSGGGDVEWTERFYFRTLQVFVGVGWPGFRRS